MTAIPSTASAIPSTATGATANAAASPATAPENPNGELGKDAFLKLMVAQLKAQNPLDPANGNEYVAELAQFSQLEQVTNLAEASSKADSAQKVAQAVQLIGHTVSYADPSTGVKAEGKVQNVEITSSGATLTVEGTAGIDPASITEVS